MHRISVPILALMGSFIFSTSQAAECWPSVEKSYLIKTYPLVIRGKVIKRKPVELTYDYKLTIEVVKVLKGKTTEKQFRVTETHDLEFAPDDQNRYDLGKTYFFPFEKSADGKSWDIVLPIDGCVPLRFGN